MHVDSIISVVALVPFGEQGEDTGRFFLVERPSLGVVDSGDIDS
jgi:hypothetical protein